MSYMILRNINCEKNHNNLQMRVLDTEMNSND
jgi:hypothetical protein